MERLNIKLLFTIVCASFILSACATTEPIYYHGKYPEAVYSYLKADDLSIAEQINIVERVIEKAPNNGKPVAPGVHAHLGMLYFESGNSTLGTSHFEQEKALFPESAHYLDFLLNNINEAQ